MNEFINEPLFDGELKYMTTLKKASDTTLVEAAVVGKSCGWFRVIVQSNSSTSKTERAHVCIQEIKTLKIIGKIFLNSEKAPSKLDALEMSPENLFEDKDIELFKEWANAPYRNTNITNWQQANYLWQDQLKALYPGL